MKKEWRKDMGYWKEKRVVDSLLHVLSSFSRTLQFYPTLFFLLSRFLIVNDGIIFIVLDYT